MMVCYKASNTLRFHCTMHGLMLNTALFDAGDLLLKNYKYKFLDITELGSQYNTLSQHRAGLFVLCECIES